MKIGKAVERTSRCMELSDREGVEFLTKLFNVILESEKIREEWRKSILVLIFKNKDDVQSCSN